jgi:mannose-6-phosphate isomerase
MKLYPLQFEPIFKERIWEAKTKNTFNKPITSTITGESWELSTVEGDVSTKYKENIDCIIDDARSKF